MIVTLDYAHFFIAIIAFVFLSGCEKQRAQIEKHRAQKFLGRYNSVGQADTGIVISKDKTGFLFYPDRQSDFSWNLKLDGESLICRGRYLFTLSFDDSFLVGKFVAGYGKTTTIRYERAK